MLGILSDWGVLLDDFWFPFFSSQGTDSIIIVSKGVFLPKAPRTCTNEFARALWV